MYPIFIRLGHEFFSLIKPAAEVRPNAETPAADPPKPSEWAEIMLGFKPSAKQAEVLDIEAKYLILCCNRQWGKTTTIALRTLHRALTITNQSIVIISRTKLQAGILIDRAWNFAASLGFTITRPRLAAITKTTQRKLHFRRRPQSGHQCRQHRQRPHRGRSRPRQGPGLCDSFSVRRPHPRRDLAHVHAAPPNRLFLQYLA